MPLQQNKPLIQYKVVVENIHPKTHTKFFNTIHLHSIFSLKSKYFDKLKLCRKLILDFHQKISRLCKLFKRQNKLLRSIVLPKEKLPLLRYFYLVNTAELKLSDRKWCRYICSFREVRSLKIYCEVFDETFLNISGAKFQRWLRTSKRLELISIVGWGSANIERVFKAITESLKRVSLSIRLPTHTKVNLALFSKTKDFHRLTGMCLELHVKIVLFSKEINYRIEVLVLTLANDEGLKNLKLFEKLAYLKRLTLTVHLKEESSLLTFLEIFSLPEGVESCELKIQEINPDSYNNFLKLNEMEPVKQFEQKWTRLTKFKTFLLEMEETYITLFERIAHSVISALPKLNDLTLCLGQVKKNAVTTKLDFRKIGKLLKDKKHPLSSLIISSPELDSSISTELDFSKDIQINLSHQKISNDLLVSIVKSLPCSYTASLTLAIDYIETFDELEKLLNTLIPYQVESSMILNLTQIQVDNHRIADLLIDVFLKRLDYRNRMSIILELKMLEMVCEPILSFLEAKPICEMHLLGDNSFYSCFRKNHQIT